jgi:SAM-dependent methyltransferase
MERMVSQRLFSYFYDDLKYNGTRAFYGWLREHLHPEMRVLNVGAGPATGNALRTLKGEVALVVGVDVDPVVCENSELDEAVIVSPHKLPFEDAHFDVAYADYVLEHVEHPKPFLKEVARVLKPGGWFFFRTPNKNHYVALGSRCTPHWMHRFIANPMRGLPVGSHEPWLTYYRLNSPGSVRRLSREAGFRAAEVRLIEPEPSYLVFNSFAFMLGVAYERLVNSTNLLSGLRANILGKLTR